MIDIKSEEIIIPAKNKSKVALINEKVMIPTGIETFIRLWSQNGRIINEYPRNGVGADANRITTIERVTEATVLRRLKALSISVFLESSVVERDLSFKDGEGNL